ncbi:MAG: YiiX/YebB-like N1pC/P60 family cysteine hydrolase [Candidatus Helarchaeota archaeon]
MMKKLKISKRSQGKINKILKGFLPEEIISILEQLKCGDIILFYNRRNLISRVIAKITKSNWDHVGIYIGYGMVVEATWPKIKLTHIFNWLKPEIYNIKILRYKTYLDKYSRKTIRHYVLSQLGKQYDLVGIFGFLFSIIFKSKKLKHIIQHIDKFYCSELVAKAYQELDLYFKDSSIEISPEDINTSNKVKVIGEICGNKNGTYKITFK